MKFILRERESESKPMTANSREFIEAKDGMMKMK